MKILKKGERKEEKYSIYIFYQSIDSYTKFPTFSLRESYIIEVLGLSNQLCLGRTIAKLPFNRADAYKLKK